MLDEFRVRSLRSLAPLLALLASCAAPRVTAGDDPRFDTARACLATATWIDRIDSGHAVAIGPDGRSERLPIAALPADAREGTVLVDGRPSPLCAARIRAYGRALRGLNANAGDTSNALRLQ